MWSTGGGETVVAEERLDPDKLGFAFRFAGAFVGSTVVAGKDIAGFSVGSGKKAANLFGASAATVWRICRRASPAGKKTVDGLVESAPRAAPVQTAVVAPIAIKAEEPSQPRTLEGIPMTEKRKPEHTEPVPEVPAALPAKADTEPIKAKRLRPKLSHVKKPTYSDVTSEEIKAARFTGAAQKVLFRRALSDLAHEDVATRAHAAEAIGGIRNELSLRTLAAHLFDEPSAQVRKECVSALAALEIKEGLPVVEHALNDSSASVRLAAVRGVYRLAGVESASILTRMFSDKNAEVRRMAVICIGWLGQENLATELVPLMADEAARVRRAAAEAMGSLGNRGVVSALIERLSDVDDSVRRKVYEAVERITGKRISEGYPENEKERERLMARWRHWWRDQAARR